MRKFLSFIITAAVLSIYGGISYGDDKMININEKKELILSAIQSCNYIKLVNELKSLANMEIFSTEDKEYLESRIIAVINEGESILDPGNNMEIIIEAKRLYPDEERFVIKYIKLYTELGQYELAFEEMRSFLRKYENKASGYDCEFITVSYALEGLDSMMSNNYARAAIDFAMVMVREPQWTGGYFLTGYLLYRMRKLEKAAQQFEKCLELNPNHQGAAVGLDVVKEEE